MAQGWLRRRAVEGGCVNWLGMPARAHRRPLAAAFVRVRPERQQLASLLARAVAQEHSDSAGASAGACATPLQVLYTQFNLTRHLPALSGACIPLQATKQKPPQPELCNGTPHSLTRWLNYTNFVLIMHDSIRPIINIPVTNGLHQTVVPRSGSDGWLNR